MIHPEYIQYELTSYCNFLKKANFQRELASASLLFLSEQMWKLSALPKL